MVIARRVQKIFLCVGSIFAFLFAPANPAIAALDNPVEVINKILFSGDASLTPSACVYQPDIDGFFTACCGGIGNYPSNPQSIRLCFPDNGAGIKYAAVSEYASFYLSPDPLNGISNWTVYTGTINNYGMALNPSAVTINTISYPANSLAVMLVSPGNNPVKQNGVARYDLTKILYYYDLRPVGDSTSVQPDYANAQDGTGTAIGALNQVDWNDCFGMLVSWDNITRAVGITANPSAIAGRNPAWASDGKAIYFGTTGAALGGIWKVNTQVPAGSAGAVSRIFTGANEGYATSIVVASCVRKFNPETIDGDQVLFRGDIASGNVNGISYLVDNGTAVEGPYVLFTGETLSNYMEQNGYYNARTALLDGSDPQVDPVFNFVFWYGCSDNQGNVYYAGQSTQTNGGAVWKYDTKGRFYALDNKNQMSLLVNSSSSSDNVSAGNPSVRQVTVGGLTVNQVLFICSKSKSLIGIHDFGCDFNRDGKVDGTDCTLLLNAIADHPIRTYNNGLSGTGKKWYEAPSISPSNTAELTAGSAPYNQDYIDYIKCDLNGNGLVTQKDVDIFLQFYPPVSGSVTLNDYTGDLTGISITISLYNPGTETLVEEDNVTLNANGEFSFNTNKVDTYDIYAKVNSPSSHWLGKQVAAVNIAPTTGATVHFNLTNGDADGNNAVNGNDISIIIATLGTCLNGQADLDGDGEISSTDLAIVLANQDKTGD